MNDLTPLLFRARQAYTQWLGSQHTDPTTGQQFPVAGKTVRRDLRKAQDWMESTRSHWEAMTQQFLQDPSRVWFWSDLHLDHHKIIRYANRPFHSAPEFNQVLLQNAQQKVQENDFLIFGGDLAMWNDLNSVPEWMKECPGKKLLILGNHDIKTRRIEKGLQSWLNLGFCAVSDLWVIPANSEYWLTHYPIDQSLIPHDVINVHGHIHEKSLPGPYINMSVEHHDYSPFRL